MLSVNDIKKLIGIKDVEIYEVEEKAGCLEIRVGKTREQVTCPKCGAKTDKVDDYRVQHVKDIKSFGRRVKRPFVKCCGKPDKVVVAQAAAILNAREDMRNSVSDSLEITWAVRDAF